MTGEKRIPYPPFEEHGLWRIAFESVCNAALHMREASPDDPASEPLELLANAEYPEDTAATRKGATYRSLAYVAYRFGMDREQRNRWYEVARALPLSQAHIGIIVARLNERDQAIADLERMLQGGQP
jgi:hypothetical protein